MNSWLSHLQGQEILLYYQHAWHFLSLALVLLCCMNLNDSDWGKAAWIMCANDLWLFCETVIGDQPPNEGKYIAPRCEFKSLCELSLFSVFTLLSSVCSSRSLWHHWVQTEWGNGWTDQSGTDQTITWASSLLTLSYLTLILYFYLLCCHHLFNGNYTCTFTTW